MSCTGVERRLVDCPHGYQMENIGCKNKVEVQCNSGNDFKSAFVKKELILTITPFVIANTRPCENGELKRNGMTSVLHICVAGIWKTLCPEVWGPTQATVACRQFIQGEKVIRKYLDISIPR